jgi:hypothetical protein
MVPLDRLSVIWSPQRIIQFGATQYYGIGLSFFMLNKLIGSFIGQKKMYNKLSSAPVLSEYSGTQQLAIVGYPAR